MLLNKLESGYLLFQTQQGSIAVEPSSFWQRVYLLWTFRNFRQLSLPLLNSRQTALINDLFRQGAAVISHEHEFEPSLEIGVVEDFVPQGIEIVATPAVRTDASPAVKTKLLEQTAGQYATPPEIPIAVAPAMKADVAPAVKQEETEMEGGVFGSREIAPRSVLDRSFAQIFSWSRFTSLNSSTHKPTASRTQVSRILISGFAAAIGALSLCVCFIVVFHRIGAAPGSQAHSSPPHLISPDSPSSPGPASAAGNSSAAPEATPQSSDSPNPATVPETTPQAGDSRDGATASEVTHRAGDSPDPAVEPATAKVDSSIPATHRRMTQQREFSGATAHVAPRSREGSHAVAFSRVRTSTSTRRMTLAPGSHGAMALSAQSYFRLADQQLHQGNYAGASANYQRAWRIEEKDAAAKGRLARARRAMQAEKESIAPLN